MTQQRARRGLFVAPFDALADPAVVGDLAAAAESAGWEGFFLWDHLQYGDRVQRIDWVGEFSAFGDETDPRRRGRMLDEGLEVVTGLLAGEPVDHHGEHYAAHGVRYLPAPPVPIWLGGRFGNAEPLRRAARHDGFFVIGLGGPTDVGTVLDDLAQHEPGPGFDVVVDLQPDQDPAPWLDSGATWVLTRVGPFDLDLGRVRALVEAGP